MEYDYHWLEADALTVAPLLLGCELVSRSADGLTAGRIVELEVYHGTADPASHAFRGLTKRTAPMFENGGTVYVYLSYGLHYCLNLVTGPAGQAQAILIRALEPTRGLDLMRRRRGKVADSMLTNGPGKVGQALGLHLEDSGSRLGTGRLELIRPEDTTQLAHLTGPRIGVSHAVNRPWRYYLADNRHVSRR